MKNLIGVSLALLIGFTHAACPNHCSGHGTCGVDEVVSETVSNDRFLLHFSLFFSLCSFHHRNFFLSSSSSESIESISVLAILAGELVVMLEAIAQIVFVLRN